ncbi:GntR family transcriptional regulator [Sphingopyxis indica]|uniref:Transcriptional regulator, GntR family n=1 Tax=Sphingopyxis indica TaxID=436663 RepID=A0A239I8B6_9SPHN|nr:FCD domain-containing protein [Sphingopyxis indica]WOF42434.1 FCD domain-containing protein [Sphingopyxis indica]SNS89548.1 transcriptional regulator, GntR family [Sphingopyxis indica]
MEQFSAANFSMSQSSYAYAQIRSGILAGEISADERLKIRGLAEELGISPGAVREALSRLVAERLVISRDQKGFVVTPLKIEDLTDLTDLRCELEGIALRRSVQRGGLEWEANVIAAAHRLRGTEQFVPGTDRVLHQPWADLHSAFHTALINACGSERLIALHLDLFEQSARYQRLAVYVSSKRDGAAEHQALVDAAIERDADRLVELATTHIRTTTDLIVQAMRYAPEAC